MNKPQAPLTNQQPNTRAVRRRNYIKQSLNQNQSHHQNQQNNKQQTRNGKYQYFLNQNPSIDHMMRSKILDTISEEGVSEQKGSATNRSITNRSEVTSKIYQLENNKIDQDRTDSRKNVGGNIQKNTKLNNQTDDRQYTGEMNYQKGEKNYVLTSIQKNRKDKMQNTYHVQKMKYQMENLNQTQYYAEDHYIENNHGLSPHTHSYYKRNEEDRTVGHNQVQAKNNNSGFSKQKVKKSINAGMDQRDLLALQQHTEYTNMHIRPISPGHSPISPGHSPIKSTKCPQCSTFSHKIKQLTQSYQLLLNAKNQELQKCKYIIEKITLKLKEYEKRNQIELDKNKKFRQQIEKKNTQEIGGRDKENQLIGYLKNREIILLEQIKQVENQKFIQALTRKKNNKLPDKRAQSQSSLNKAHQQHPHGASQSSLYKVSPDYVNQLSYFPSKISQNSKNSLFDDNGNSRASGRFLSKIVPEFKQQTQSMDSQVLQHVDKTNFITNMLAQQMHSFHPYQSSSCSGMLERLSLVQRVQLGQIIRKTNQIQSLKDCLMVSQLKTKIQQAKSLQIYYMKT